MKITRHWAVVKWSSGQDTLLLLRQSKFEYCKHRADFSDLLDEKTKINEKEAGEYPFFKNID